MVRRIDEEDWRRYLALRQRFPLAVRLDELWLHNPTELRVMLEDEPETVDRMVEQAVEVKAGPGSSEEDRTRVRRREHERLDQVRDKPSRKVRDP